PIELQDRNWRIETTILCRFRQSPFCVASVRRRFVPLCLSSHTLSHLHLSPHLSCAHTPSHCPLCESLPSATVSTHGVPCSLPAFCCILLVSTLNSNFRICFRPYSHHLPHLLSYPYS